MHSATQDMHPDHDHIWLIRDPSCSLGICFTAHRYYYGCTMGDAFTLAGYVISVGPFVSLAVLAQHYRHCKCWKRGKEEEDIELERLQTGCGRCSKN